MLLLYGAKLLDYANHAAITTYVDRYDRAGFFFQKKCPNFTWQEQKDIDEWLKKHFNKQKPPSFIILLTVYEAGGLIFLNISS